LTITSRPERFISTQNCKKTLRTRKKSGRLTPFGFTNESGKDSIGSLRGSWDAAWAEAKIGKRLSHDFRRTAARNMVRTGITDTDSHSR
jgi:hypothetical protein